MFYFQLNLMPVMLIKQCTKKKKKLGKKIRNNI